MCIEGDLSKMLSHSRESAVTPFVEMGRLARNNSCTNGDQEKI